MNVHQAAAYLAERGYACKAGTVRRLAHAGQIVHYRIGVSGRGPMEFTTDQLDQFLREAVRGFAPAAPEPKPTDAAPRPPRKKKAAAAVAAAPSWKDELRDVRGK